MRKYLTIYEEAVSHIRLCSCSILNFHIYEENLISFFISVYNQESCLNDVKQFLSMFLSRLIHGKKRKTTESPPNIQMGGEAGQAASLLACGPRVRRLAAQQPPAEDTTTVG
jgi:hypothetical protein